LLTHNGKGFSPALTSTVLAKTSRARKADDTTNLLSFCSRSYLYLRNTGTEPRTELLRISQAIKYAVLAGCWLCATSQILCAAEKLLDAGFEASTPNGTFPDSGFWFPASAGAGASAICTTTAGRSGNATTTNGLWNFTGTSSNDWWSGPFQDTSAYTGAVFSASAWIRTPTNQPFVAGSKAFIRVDFLGATTNVLAS
jgi:hypothetical protein